MSGAPKSQPPIGGQLLIHHFENCGKGKNFDAVNEIHQRSFRVAREVPHEPHRHARGKKHNQNNLDSSHFYQFLSLLYLKYNTHGRESQEFFYKLLLSVTKNFALLR